MSCCAVRAEEAVNGEVPALPRVALWDMPAIWPRRTGLGLNVEEADRGPDGDSGDEVDLMIIDFELSMYRPPSGGSSERGGAGVMGVCVAKGVDGLETEDCAWRENDSTKLADRGSCWPVRVDVEGNTEDVGPCLMND